MNFLATALKEAYGSKVSIIEVLRTNLSKPQKERSHKEIHASDLTKEHFCPREIAIMDILKKERGDVKPSAAQAATWDLGNATADLVREKWLGDNAIGNWHCVRCNQVQTHCRKPGHAGCLQTVPYHPHVWKYDEVKFWAPSHEFSGSLDVILDLGAPKWSITELKIMDKDEFAKLAAPLAEHRVRTNLYMWLVENSDHPLKDKLNVNTAKILYTIRGFGKKHEQYNEILPWKEFDVDRDDSSLGAPLNRALAVRAFRKEGIVPAPLGNSMFCPKAKGCSVAATCLSGKIPHVVPLPSHPTCPTVQGVTIGS